MTPAEEAVDRELHIAEGLARAENPSAAVARLRLLARRLKRASPGLPGPARAQLLARVSQAEARYRREAEAWEAGVRERAARYRAREEEAARSRRAED